MKRAIKRLIIVIVAITVLACSNHQPKDTEKWIGYTQSGTASFYGDKHQFKQTASGELYKHSLRTAAHRDLPFGSIVRVTNIENGEDVVVEVNDRGPFVTGRIIDLSKSAFSSIGSTDSGLISVQIEVLE